MTYDRRTRRYATYQANIIIGSVFLGLLLTLMVGAKYKDSEVRFGPAHAQDFVQPTTPTPTVDMAKFASPSGQFSYADSIKEYVGKFPWNTKLALAIVQCESGFNPEAKNKYSTARGLWQFIEATWIRERKIMGKDTNLDLRFDPFEATDTAYSLYSRNFWFDWDCYPL